MQAHCPVCCVPVDLFSSYIFAKHAYAQRNPTVQVVCPKCGALSPQDHQVTEMECAECGHSFNAVSGSRKRQESAVSTHCHCEFNIGHTIRETGSPPTYRMYAKLVLTSDGKKEYHPITVYDEALYEQAVSDLEKSPYRIPQEYMEPGYNTNQALNYGFLSWSHMFNARQLLCISTLANRIKEIEDNRLRDAFACLFSGAIEFNNMFASYKGEGTGAVRHMFYHHILKPERTPLEANIWGTPKSSGAFSTLFRSRLLRATQYAQQPFELALLPENQGNRSVKVDSINEPITGIANSASYDHFSEGGRLYVSCGDSAATDLPDECVDVIVTDPPFFDNVHYSQLADFFYAWQKLILDDLPSHQASTTRSESEVQNSDAETFTERLTLVLQEACRVLKGDGLLVFTYHHSRWEGWQSVLHAVTGAGFRIEACHPVKAEMSVAAPKRQAKDPINFDIIIVCRKNRTGITMGTCGGKSATVHGIQTSGSQVARLRAEGWNLSRNDVGVVVMAQAVAEISRQPQPGATEQAFAETEHSIAQAIDRIHC